MICKSLLVVIGKTGRSKARPSLLRFYGSDSHSPSDAIKSGSEIAESSEFSDFDSLNIAGDLAHPQLTSVIESGSVAAAVPELSYYKAPQLVMALIDNIHVVSGMPYWGSIVTATVFVRLLMAPLAIRNLVAAGRMQRFQPEMQELTAKFQADPEGVTPEGRARYEKTMRELMAKHKVSPFGSILALGIQIPIFMSFFFGLQDMGTYFPDIATGGAFWFVDLTANDGYFLLPILNSLSMLIMVESSNDKSPQAQTLKGVMRAVAVIMLPVTCSMPQSVLLYWLTSNTFSVAFSKVMGLKGVKSYLGIPDAPKPVVGGVSKLESPFAVILREINKSKETKAPPNSPQ